MISLQIFRFAIWWSKFSGGGCEDSFPHLVSYKPPFMGYVLLPSLLAWRWTKDDEMHLIRQRMLKTACLKGLLSTVLAKKKTQEGHGRTVLRWKFVPSRTVSHTSLLQRARAFESWLKGMWLRNKMLVHTLARRLWAISWQLKTDVWSNSVLFFLHAPN